MLIEVISIWGYSLKKRDSWVSVMYAEELNSAKSSATLQSTDRHGIWYSSLRIFKCFCEHGAQSIRQLAQQTGLAKSSVHRLRQAMERRSGSPEAGMWETEAGRQWLTRLVVATLYTFGLKRGVGVDTMSEFFVRLRLQQ